LTKTGCEAASSVIRRHMLTEWMLARMLKVPWSSLHAEADQIEHSISDEIETRCVSTWMTRSSVRTAIRCPALNMWPPTGCP